MGQPAFCKSHFIGATKKFCNTDHSFPGPISIDQSFTNKVFIRCTDAVWSFRKLLGFHWYCEKHNENKDVIRKVKEERRQMDKLRKR